MAETILIVDDEESVRDVLTEWLKDQGYSVLSSPNGIKAMREIYHHKPDLVVADILMPEMDGYEFCRLAREVSAAPFMFLTALINEKEKVKGFNLGADDYVVKPVGMEEFRARVGALLRYKDKLDPGAEYDSGYSDSVLRIDLDRHEVWVRGKPVELTLTEFRLLCFLTEGAGKSCRLQDILLKVWDSPHYPAEVIKWHIAKIRGKIEEDPRNPELVLTVRGIGYRYEPPEIPRRGAQNISAVRHGRSG